ncbi:MAG TPA: bifunctional DNA-formamidopyrimidine glycosylase/DNA-(apurinic or apyrimidinic site) lyase [candidate division Zixibacteria bacterium]|nr:bifunctional DNA-formamidopyrimidine glycosylase/DNA-(apurinic or apyrimidinic site) lyase [candidate division Zixibacteria bacterium]
MPELPEVETIRRGLRKRLRGRRIEQVEVLEPRLRVEVDGRLASRLRGRAIVDVGRRAKYVLIRLEDGGVWLFHLGMSGKLIYVDPALPRQKHDHIVARLDNGAELRYHDPRRFGLSLVAEKTELPGVAQLGRLGPDPFDRRFSAGYLYACTRKSSRRIRDLLLDQGIVAGIGNIYANEALYRAGVRPTARSRRLTRAEVGRLAAAIPELLREAIRWCGTSFSDYRDADDRFGEFQSRLAVYGRQGEPCRMCGTPVRRVVLGNRSAFYCPACQAGTGPRSAASAPRRRRAPAAVGE